MTYSLGVDLGTTTSAAAARRGNRLEACTLGDLEATMPSVALDRSDGSIVVGEAARDRALYDTTLIARHITPRLNDGPVILAGRAHDPVRLAHALLETVIDRVRRLHGDRPYQTVLTYPLFPASGAAGLLEDVAARAVGNRRLIPHPIAAAAKFSYDVDIGAGTTIAVVDFGGGTFEVTLVRRTSHGFDIVGPPGGIADFGGVEIDDAVLGEVEAVVGDVRSRLAPEDPQALAYLRQLRTACRTAKEQLSYRHEAVVDVVLPHVATRVPITRARFDHRIRPAITGAVDVVARTIGEAGLARADVQVALLVGGSSRIPLFVELMAARTGLPIVADPFPELTVALGAALFGDDHGPTTRRSAGAASVPVRNDPGAANVHPAAAIAADEAADVGQMAAWFADPAAAEPADSTDSTEAAWQADAETAWQTDTGTPTDPAWQTDHGTPTDPAWHADTYTDSDPAWQTDHGTPTDTAWQTDTGTPTDPAWDTDTYSDAEAAWDTDTYSDAEAAWHTDTYTDAEPAWHTDTYTDAQPAWETEPGPGVAAAAANGAPTAIAGPTTGETDLWGGGRNRGRRRGRHDRADPTGGAQRTLGGEGRGVARLFGDGADSRVVVGVIGAALAVVTVATVALASSMGGSDNPPIAIATPIDTASTTEPPTSGSTTATTVATTTTASTTTTTVPEPEPAPAPTTAPVTTAPTTSTTTTEPPPTTTTTRPRPPTTTTTTFTTTTTPSSSTTTTTHPGPPG